MSSEAKQAVASDPMAFSRAAVDRAKADKSGRIYRVYCDGIFDIFHVGHMKMLEQAKKALGAERTWLIAGVNSDELTHKFKGKTVYNHELRCESVRHCKWVDEVAPDAPWVMNQEFLDKYKIDFVAHDALPYTDTSGSSADGDCYSFVKKQGKFLETKRTDGISTSDIIVMIVKDYDAYVERNLQRGYTKEQLGVGRTWEMRSIMHQKEKKLKESVNKTKTEWKDLSETARAFVRRFKPEGADGKMAMPRVKSDPALKDGFEGILHHAWGLTRSSFSTCGYILSFVNPLSYVSVCCSKKKKKS